MAVPVVSSTGRAVNVNRSGGYTGLGPIQSYGYANPLGPYAALGTQSSSSGKSPTGTSPQNSAALEFLNSVVSGNTLPYSQQQQDAMYGQASGMNAAAEAAQNQQAEEAAAAGGASPTDPSYQSQMRQNMARRQTGNQRAMGDIQARAGSENFGARTGAAGQILGAEQANADREERQRMRAMSMLGDMYGNMNSRSTVQPQSGMWQFSGTTGSYGR